MVHYFPCFTFLVFYSLLSLLYFIFFLSFHQFPHTNFLFLPYSLPYTFPHLYFSFSCPILIFNFTLIFKGLIFNNLKSKSLNLPPYQCINSESTELLFVVDTERRDCRLLPPTKETQQLFQCFGYSILVLVFWENGIYK